jgi:hypothetical protein
MRWKLPTLAALTAVVLAGGGALAGLAAGGVAGAVIGAVVSGGLAGVAAGYVPLFQDRAWQRAEAAGRAAAALAAVREPGLDGDGAPPSLLLRPERAVVGFTGRADELVLLRAWCRSGEERSVRVVAGPGGTGKTRLALQVTAEWQAAGREAVQVAAGEEASVLGRVRAVTPGSGAAGGGLRGDPAAAGGAAG